MPYRLGTSSLKNLDDVHPALVEVVKRAIQVTKQDFGVHDGARTLEEQREYVKRGVSKTMNSRHLVQKDGLGHAVDLVPYINGKLRWELDACFPIAVAMGRAAAEREVELVWGCVWDRRMSSYDCGSVEGLRKAVEAYKKRHAGSDFLDGPHFELARIE